MFSPRSLFAKLADQSRHTIVVAFALALACAVPVFAASSFDSSNTGDVAGDVTVDKPDGLAVGDVMVASVAYWGPTTTTVTSSGWTQIAERTHTQPNPDLTLVSFWKQADALDVAATNFTFDLSVNARAFGGIARYDDVVVDGVPATPLAGTPGFATNPATDSNAGQSESLAATGVPTTAPGQYVSAIYALTTSTAISQAPAGMTPLYDEARTTGTDPARLAAFDVSQATAGSAGDRVATAAATTRYIAHTIALKTKPTKLGFSTAEHTGAVDACIGPMTVETQNTAGGATRPLADTEVSLATDDPSSSGSFFSDDGCATALTQSDRTVGTGATGVSFYYKPLARGTGAHEISATAAGLDQADQTQTVKLAQTITFAAPPVTEETYGESFEITLPGNASPSDLPVTVGESGGCTLSGTTVTMTSGSDDCVLTASQPGDADYAPAPDVAYTVAALKRLITITADAKSKVYDNTAVTDPALTYQVTGTLASGDSFTGALARAAGQNAGTYAITQNTVSPGSTDDYDVTYVGANFVIDKKELLMHAEDGQKTYGDDDPTLTADLDGFIPAHNNRSQAGVSGLEACTRDPGETVAGSPYAITCAEGTLTATNYSFTTGDSGEFTINPAQLAVDANPASKTYGDADPALTATLNGFVNGETAATAGVIGAASCTRPGAGTDEDAGTYTGAITCAANTLSAPNYTFATGALADFTIDQREAHATFTVADKVYDRTTAATVTGESLANRAPSDDAADVFLTGTRGAAAFSDFDAGGNKTVTVDQGTLALDGPEVLNYTLAIDTATADINPKPVDGSFAAADKVYNGITGATVTSRSVDAADVISPDVVTLTGGSANFANPNAGNGKTVTLTGATTGGAAGPNYTVGTVATDTANITKRNVTGSFTAADKDFDGTAAATITGRSLSNAVPGDAVALIGGSATFADANPGVDKTVTGTGFGLGGTDAGNYNLTGVGTTTATISRQPAGNTPPPADVTEDAEKALGGPVKELAGLDLAGLGFAFAPENQKGTLKVGKGALKLFAIGGCDSPCTVNAKKTIVLTTEGGASAAGTKKLKLKAQNLSLAAGEFGVVKLKKLTKKQRKAIQKAKKAKLIVKVTLESAGQQVTDKKKYGLKLKKG